MSDPKDFDKNSANNTTVGGISIAEGASTAQMNDSQREILAVIAAPADFGSAADAIKIDKIAESTANEGVEIDGVKHKDGNTSTASIVDSNEAFLLAFKPSTTPVNYLDIASADTGDPVAIQAAGTDANVGIDLQPKGSGEVTINGEALGGGAPTQQIFTTSGTWTKPANCKYALVRVQGPGGGGGGSTNTNARVGGGGGAGGWCQKLIDVSAIASATVTIGTGGAAGTTTTDGSAGSGPSSWSDGTNTLTANAGAGGSQGTSTLTTAAGGTATGGDINVQGQAGSENGAHSIGCHNGEGGSSPFGSGGKARVDQAPNPATGYGSGGGGGDRNSTSAAGGAGTDGILTVWELY